MLTAPSRELVKQIKNKTLLDFAQHLLEWLSIETQTDLAQLTESRVRALLLAARVVDDPTIHDFEHLMQSQNAVRTALYDLLNDTKLTENTAVVALISQPAKSDHETIPWLSLILLANAHTAQYPPFQLDPASPPDSHSPAGQVVRRTGHFLRRQIQRSATDRDKMTRQLTYTGPSGAQELDDLPAQPPAAPLPPHYRPPIPVRYPEVDSETLSIEPQASDPPTVARGEQITITPDDLSTETGSQPTRMPAIRIDKDDIQSTTHTQPQTPPSTDATSRRSFTDAVRSTLSRDKEPLTATKLRVIVQEYPDGPGLYGLQIQVRCKGINSFVAGTTNRDGSFLCELPVKLHSGLTYDVSVTWPRDYDSEVETKAITLNADRTEFTLPFYMRHRQQD